jgi:type I restriction enzyme, R subunit
MTEKPILATNFALLEAHDEQLLRLGLLAERYFPEDPNTALLKLRQLTELLAQHVAANVGEYLSTGEPQYDLIRRLQDQGILPREIAQLFGEVRRAGNAASHAMSGDHRTALAALKITWQLAVWFHRTFKDAAFKSGPFIPPQAPKDESEDLRAELDRLSQTLAEYRAAHDEATERLDFTEAQLRQARDEQSFWEQMATDAELAKSALSEQLCLVQSRSSAQSEDAVAQLITASNQAAEKVRLDESETRKLIDEQLRQAGWLADSAVLRYSKGARPEKGKNLAIAEWPTASGPADYALFAGLMPLGTIEAKRENLDVSGCLQQAKRYSRGFDLPEAFSSPGGPCGGYRLPFAFSTNGRPHLRQLATRSGIWFCDLRRPDNLGHALDGWYTPEGLTALLKRDEERANADIKTQPFAYGFTLYPFQISAVQAAEAAIAEGSRLILLAMATGTGKTKTSIALIYRLLKAQRFRRILFLVDRSALGEQAANAFKNTRMESLQTFADIFGIKELKEQQPDTDTAAQIATVQAMVQRVLYPAEGMAPPPVDQYDCIVVDECHRGSLLDRDLSDMELGFRSFENYISKYRRVLEPEKYARAALEGGDILLGIIRATKVARVPDELNGANITQGTAHFRPSCALRSKFLTLALEAPATQRWLHRHYRGIDMPGLNLADVRRVPVPIPSLEEQDEIIRRVESILSYAENLEARYAAARAQVERLTPALLAKAFRGELVPQNPNDEPASMLLEHIHAARAAASVKPRRATRSPVPGKG